MCKRYFFILFVLKICTFRFANYSVITNLDSNGLPKYLSMDDQSRFAIGYYHQREDLYKTTTDKEKN